MHCFLFYILVYELTMILLFQISARLDLTPRTTFLED